MELSSIRFVCCFMVQNVLSLFPNQLFPRSFWLKVFIYCRRTVNYDLSKYPPEKIRNFAICAHVDHGKSTLADRLLQCLGVIDNEAQKQYLDKLAVERLRGITIKAQTSSMFYNDFMFNLVDTPGHVDFSFEVRRSLYAIDGVLLLIAANQGIQAQTLANFWLALETGLEIIPIINKIDMEHANVPGVEQQLLNHFGFKQEDILRISAKTGQNIPDVLQAILRRIPSPNVSREGPFRAHIFDSWFDEYRGVIALITVKSGILRSGRTVRLFNNKKDYDPVEIGIMHPEMRPCNALYAGQIGYIQFSMKSVGEIMVGDTVHDPEEPCSSPLVEISSMRPTVYAGLFPVDPDKYASLSKELERLRLNDTSVSISPEMSVVLGQGWRVGFLGSLHLEVFGQRLSHEYREETIFTNPLIEYRAEIVENDTIRKKRYNGRSEITITTPDTFPEQPQDIKRYFEPMSTVNIICPTQFLQAVDSFCEKLRGERGEVITFDSEQTLTKWRLPLAETYSNFFDEIKSLTSGMASVEQHDDGFRECPLTKISIYVNENLINEFSSICPEEVAKSRAAKLVNKIKQEITRQQFEITIKAVLGKATRPVAQARIKAYKKDFTGVMKGNLVQDRLRKKLKHQAEGKSKLKSLGAVQITKEAFLNVFKK